MEMQAALTNKEDLTIKITDDGMKAFMSINNYQDEVSLDVDTIMNKLWDKGVKFGIKEQVINTMLEKKIYERSILIAEGTPPQDGRDAVIEYKFKKKDKVNLTQDLDGKVDFRNLGLIDVVETGDVIATKIPPTQGVPGKKVTGEEIPAKKGQDIPILLGKNTRLSSNGLVLLASSNGYVFWENGRVGVKTSYEVDGDVDMNVGNIYFIGPVKVKGEVKEGFTINTKGDIEIGGGVENATLISTGNITVRYGIIGEKTKIMANGDLKCKFIQNANVEVKGNIIVYDSIWHSNVSAGKGVFVLGGKKGAIIGGRIRAHNEVNAKNIGNMSEVPTVIEVGIEPGIRAEMIALEENLLVNRNHLEEERLNYKTLITLNKMELANQSLAKQKELEEIIKMMSHHLNQYKKHTASNHIGKVSVVDTLWPGVKLTIGDAIFLPKIDYRYVTFVNKTGRVEQRGYEKPKMKAEELLLLPYS